MPEAYVSFSMKIKPDLSGKLTLTTNSPATFLVREIGHFLDDMALGLYAITICVYHSQYGKGEGRLYTYGYTYNTRTILILVLLFFP